MAESSAPVWKQLFDAAERTVGTRVNELARSENFAIIAGLTARLQREAAERGERMSRQFLHMANLPAGSDVNRLLAQIAKLEREVRELRKQIDDDATPARRPTTRKVASDGGLRQPRTRARQDSA
ncbi:MAG: hypothetical protein QM733_19095 [Ilumatobacteraceae bacterium]